MSDWNKKDLRKAFEPGPELRKLMRSMESKVEDDHEDFGGLLVAKKLDGDFNLEFLLGAYGEAFLSTDDVIRLSEHLSELVKEWERE